MHSSSCRGLAVTFQCTTSEGLARVRSLSTTISIGFERSSCAGFLKDTVSLLVFLVSLRAPRIFGSVCVAAALQVSRKVPVTAALVCRVASELFTILTWLSRAMPRDSPPQTPSACSEVDSDSEGDTGSYTSDGDDDRPAHCCGMFQFVHRSATLPVIRFPQDILLEIFRWCTSQESVAGGRCTWQVSPWRISAVCRAWRAVALSSSVLWDHIFFDFVWYQRRSKKTSLAVRCERDRAYLSTHLRRSGVRPLMVTLRSMSLGVITSGGHPTFMWTQLWQCKDRWRSVDLGLKGPDVMEYDAILAYFSQHLPTLRSLDISHDVDTSIWASFVSHGKLYSRWLFQGASVLSHLSLGGLEIDGSKMTTLPSIRSLKLSDIQGDALSTALCFLKCCSHLVELTLERMDNTPPMVWGPVFDVPKKVDQLTTLRLVDSVGFFERLSSRIEFPSVYSLDVTHINSIYVSGETDVLDKYVRSLRSIVLCSDDAHNMSQLMSYIVSMDRLEHIGIVYLGKFNLLDCFGRLMMSLGEPRTDGTWFCSRLSSVSIDATECGIMADMAYMLVMHLVRSRNPLLDGSVRVFSDEPFTDKASLSDKRSTKPCRLSAVEIVGNVHRVPLWVFTDVHDRTRSIR